MEHLPVVLLPLQNHNDCGVNVKWVLLTIIHLCWNLWHNLLLNTAVNVFGSLQDIPPGNGLYQNPAHRRIASILLPSLFVVLHFLSGWGYH